MKTEPMVRKGGLEAAFPGRGMVATLLLALLLPGCRDATDPAGDDPLEKVSRDLPRRLTYSSEDDRAPAWSADGQSVYYDTPGLPPFSQTPGLLLEVPAVGGDAVPLFPALQLPSGTERWFAAPVTSPSGDRVAYVEMENVSSGNLCPGAPNVFCSPSTAGSFGPRLRGIRFWVREPGTRDAAPSFDYRFPGVTELEPPPGISRSLEVEIFPFHLLYNEERSYVFRPSWDPEGRRLVLSTGRALAVWEVDSGNPPAFVTGALEAVHPAWSPDGEWIAFTQLVAGAPIQAACSHATNFGNTACQQTRTVYPVEERRIMLVRPDGSELTEVGEGEQPAWTPDSERLVFRRGGRLVLAPVDGGGATPIPDTEGGIEPAVSPDGRLLAFARPGGGGDYDIWVTRLDGDTP